MPADYSRIHRLLKILTLIQAEPGWTAERLAGECGTSTRTIYRDMKMLEGAGIPYYFDSEAHGYRVRRDFFMPPIEMTLDESLALIALGEKIGGQEQIPFTQAAGRAIAKLRSQLPAAIRQELDHLDQHVAIRLAQAGPDDANAMRDVYETIRAALLSRRALRCRYESLNPATGEGEMFHFHPYALLFSQRAWYAIGHHAGRGEVRCLKLNRFARVQPTDLPYEIPADFSVEKHLGNAWRLIRGEQTYSVELRFDAAFAETIADTHWHPTQEIDWQPDGSILFRCTVDGLDEIVWWVLSMGPHCRVLNPPELASRIRTLAQQILENDTEGVPAGAEEGG